MAAHSSSSQFVYKIFRLLDREYRHKAVRLLVLTFFGMVLETLSVGFVIPALTVITTEDIAARYPALAPTLTAMGNPSQGQLVVIGMLVLLGIYVVKSAFLAFLSWRQGWFIYGLQASIARRLFTNYLHQPYTFHLQRNSAQLIRNLTVEVNHFTNAMGAAMVLVTEGLVLAGITALLFVVEPLGALVVSLSIGAAALTFRHNVRTHIEQWGKSRQYHDGLRIQHIQQGLGSVKDIKILGRERDFLQQYQVHNYAYARLLQRQYFFQQLPRLWLELLAVAGLAAVTLMMVGRGRPSEALLPVLGLFGAAAFRLIPSVNRAMVGVQTADFARAVVDVLYMELVELRAPPADAHRSAMPFRKQIALQNVSFQYANTNNPALKDISLAIPFGASVGFVGGSGAGKSTLIDVILGLLSPTSGAVLVDDADIQLNLRSWQDQIGYVPQSIYLTDDTLRRNIAFGLPDDQIDDVAVQRAVRYAQLEDFVGTLALGLETVVGERGVRLSGGQRQRIGIARALYHDPSVLVLDEATSSLDTATEAGVMEAIKAMHGEKTILIIAHRFSTVEHCDRLIRVEQGSLIQGKAAIPLAASATTPSA